MLQHELTEALRADAQFDENVVRSFLVISLIIEHGRQQEAKGTPFAEWLNDIEAMLGEYA